MAHIIRTSLSEHLAAEIYPEVLVQVFSREEAKSPNHASPGTLYNSKRVSHERLHAQTTFLKFMAGDTSAIAYFSIPT